MKKDYKKPLSSSELMDAIEIALNEKRSLSIVSVGQTEAFIMAQYTIFSEEEFMNHREAYNANRAVKTGFLHRGVRFPNIDARDDAVAAARKADIIGYNLIEPWAKQFTEKVFSAYLIEPEVIFEANIRRVIMFSQQAKFANILQGRNVLLVGSLAPEAKDAMEAKYLDKLDFNIVGAISIYEYDEIPDVKEQICKHDFDLCLLGAGVNALILAPFAAETCGAVAFDIGWGIKSLIDGEVVLDSFINDVIGLENLMNM